MRIASLVPSATEMLFALGLGNQVVAVTHECDWPAEATNLPHLTSSVIPEGLTEREIDEAVRTLTGEGRALYELDRSTLEQLDVDLIVTQAVCEVCAVSFDDVVAVASTLPKRPQVLSLDPSTLDDVIADIARLGTATGSVEAADELVCASRERIAAVQEAVGGRDRPSVIALEWLDPPFIGGHWVPEMIELAGASDALGKAGAKSRQLEWDALHGLQTSIAILMPCGYDTARSLEEARLHRAQLATLRTGRLVAVDAAAYFSRPGPRLIDGVELLAHLFHPDSVSAPPPGRFQELIGNS